VLPAGRLHPALISVCLALLAVGDAPSSRGDALPIPSPVPPSQAAPEPEVPLA
jgi:hypothetical protein